MRRHRELQRGGDAKAPSRTNAEHSYSKVLHRFIERNKQFGKQPNENITPKQVLLVVPDGLNEHQDPDSLLRNISHTPITCSLMLLLNAGLVVKSSGVSASQSRAPAYQAIFNAPNCFLSLVSFFLRFPQHWCTRHHHRFNSQSLLNSFHLLRSHTRGAGSIHALANLQQYARRFSRVRGPNAFEYQLIFDQTNITLPLSGTVRSRASPAHQHYDVGFRR